MTLREVLLNLLLVAQVVASVIMSGLLAYRVTPELPVTSRPQLMPVVTPEPAPMPDLLRPTLIWAYTPEMGYGGVTPGELAYEVSWQQLRDVVVRALAMPPQPQAVSGSELTLVARQPVVAADLPVRLPASDLVEIWAQALPPSWRSSLEPERWPAVQVDRVVIGLGNPGGLYLVGSGGALRLLLPFAGRVEMEELARGLTGPERTPYRGLKSQQVREMAGTRPPQLLLPEMDAPLLGQWVLAPDVGSHDRLPVLEVDAAIPRRAQELLPLFFPDQTVVREIQEPGGTRIYTDGRRALRLYASGALEYTESQPRPSSQPVSSLQETLAVVHGFVSTRNLWPEGVVLTHLSGEEGRQRLAFSVYRQGRPVLSYRPLLDIIITGGRVNYLYAEAHFSAGSSLELEPVVPPETALRAAYAQRTRMGAHPQEARIDRVTLGYRLDGVTLHSLVPVWHVAFQDGEERVVDGQTGRVLP